jgi:steroid delta-isomerase-like uncharacterized protein
MTREDRVTVVNRWFDEVWEQGRMESVDELFAADGIAFGIGEAGLDVKGPEQFKPFIQKIRTAFSNVRFDIHENIVEGDTVVTRWTANLCHTGAGFGPPTGRDVKVDGISWTRIQDGQIVGGYNNWDMLGLIQQINAEPIKTKILEDVLPK